MPHRVKLKKSELVTMIATMMSDHSPLGEKAVRKNLKKFKRGLLEKMLKGLLGDKKSHKRRR